MSDALVLFGFHAVLSRLRQHAASVQEILNNWGQVKLNA
jgi:23S rRNA (guanosine2251-2'-O)-methyltransferase